MLTGLTALVVGDASCAGAVASALTAAGARVSRSSMGSRPAPDTSIDILAIVAPTPDASPIADLDETAWRTLIDTHLTAAFDLTRAALPALRASGHARLLYIVAVPSSPQGAGRLPGHVIASGLSALAEVFALELAPDQIQVNTVVSRAPVLDETASAAVGQAVVTLARSTFITGETVHLQ